MCEKEYMLVESTEVLKIGTKAEIEEELEGQRDYQGFSTIEEYVERHDVEVYEIKKVELKVETTVKVEFL